MCQDRKSTHLLSLQEKHSNCGEIWFNLLLINHRLGKWEIEKQKTPSPHPLSSETKLCPWIIHLLPMNGAGRWRMITLYLCHWFLFMLFPCSSGGVSHLGGGSPTWHSLTDRSSVCYSQGLLSFRSWWLQHELLAGSTSPVKILDHAWARHGPQLPPRAFCFMGSLELAALCDTPWAAGEQLASL